MTCPHKTGPFIRRVCSPRSGSKGSGDRANEGEAPITVYFDLAEAVPPALRNLYGIADG
jgi:hypothetical protein